MLSPRGILHLGFLVGISILWMSSLISAKRSPIPLGSPSPSPSPSSPPPLQPPPLPSRHSQPPFKENSSPTVRKEGLNKGKKMGLLLASVAGLLQIVVVTYLLVKRKQMLRVVQKYEA